MTDNQHDSTSNRSTDLDSLFVAIRELIVSHPADADTLSSLRRRLSLARPSSRVPPGDVEEALAWVAESFCYAHVVRRNHLPENPISDHRWVWAQTGKPASFEWWHPVPAEPPSYEGPPLHADGSPVSVAEACTVLAATAEGTP